MVQIFMGDGPSGFHTYIMRSLGRKFLFLLVLISVYDSVSLTGDSRICAIYGENKVLPYRLPEIETSNKIIIPMSLHF